MTSTIKVNNIQNQCGANIINESSNTITIGASGDTIALASGASQSGFGRTGTVDWQTTPKTGDFTAANGEGYFVNTTSGTITMTMPSGSAGAIVSIQDYNKTFDSNAFTVAPASGEKINGGSASGTLLISTEGQGLTFVYVDGTVGWKTVHENEFTSGGSTEIVATGGTITTSGDYKIHTFTGPGTFCVSSISSTPGNNTVSYMVVAGGGAGGTAPSTIRGAGGGGAGGFREYKGPADCYTASPLNGNPGGTAITVTAQAYPITVGAGGTGSGTVGCNTSGANSIFSTVTSAGGGKAGSESPTSPQTNGTSGGSGGGGGVGNASGTGGSGNTPPVSPAQGSNGGNSSPPALGSPYSPVNHAAGGGGGGATAVGTAGQAAPGTSLGGNGGAGATTSISGSPTAYGGGGGGATGTGPASTKGAGGAGGGGQGDCGPGSRVGQAGTANTGGGGGGNVASPVTGYNGGSGIVIIRYKFQ